MGGSGSSSMWDHTAFDLGASLLRACAIVSRISEPNCASCACAKSLCAHHCPKESERERERMKRMSLTVGARSCTIVSTALLSGLSSRSSASSIRKSLKVLLEEDRSCVGEFTVNACQLLACWGVEQSYLIFACDCSASSFTRSYLGAPTERVGKKSADQRVGRWEKENSPAVLGDDDVDELGRGAVERVAVHQHLLERQVRSCTGARECRASFSSERARKKKRRKEERGKGKGKKVVWGYRGVWRR